MAWYVGFLGARPHEGEGRGGSLPIVSRQDMIVAEGSNEGAFRHFYLALTVSTVVFEA